MSIITDILDDRSNFYCRGLIPDHHYRFVLARNSSVTVDICGKHNASAEMCALMGEAMMGSFFLASHFTKQEKMTVSLHLECSGDPKSLIATANSDGGIRVMSSNPEAKLDRSLRKGGGLLSVNRWRDDTTKVYSSTVEMRDTTIDKNIEEFIGKSEQIQSFIKMEASFKSCDTVNISGYIFQALPEASFEDTDAIVDMLVHTSPKKMLDQFLNTDNNFRNNFKTENIFHNIKILNNGKFFHHCRCSREKVESMLFALGKDSAEESLQKDGKIEIQCEFCKKYYYFTQEDVFALFRRG